MKDFNKFNSLTLIRDNMDNIVLDRFRSAVGDTRCYVSEKIHGANYQVVTNGTDVKFGRRTGYLTEGESFYGCSYINKPLAEKAKALFNDMKEMIMESHRVCDHLEAKGEPCNRPSIPRDFQEISITGEFFGGNYPHPDVVAVQGEGAGQVGKGHIWYGQTKSFMAFEIAIDGEVQDIYTLGSLCNSFGIPVVPILFWGSFDECLEFSKEHYEEPTLVPLMTPLVNAKGAIDLDEDGNFKSLPAIEGNMREGHVIAPVTPLWMPNGKRAVFKHKNSKHLESGRGDKPKKEPVLVELNEKQQAVWNALAPCITVNRMQNVVSHEGEVTSKDFMRICGLVVQDAIEETMDSTETIYALSWDTLTTKERKLVTKQLGRLAAEVLRKEFF